MDGWDQKTLDSITDETSQSQRDEIQDSAEKNKSKQKKKDGNGMKKRRMLGRQPG